jgi:hypothetical protein
MEMTEDVNTILPTDELESRLLSNNGDEEEEEEGAGTW